MTIIEIIGCTSSGKSTFINYIKENFDINVYESRDFLFKYLPILNKNKKVQSLMIDFCSIIYLPLMLHKNNFFLIKMLSNTISDENTIFRKINLFRNFLKLYFMFEFLKNHNSKDIVVFDEGLIFSICNFFIISKTKPNLEKISSFLLNINTPQKIIYIDCNSNEILDRCTNRKDRYYSDFNSRKISLLIKNSKQIFEHVIDNVLSNKKIMKINNNDMKLSKISQFIFEN